MKLVLADGTTLDGAAFAAQRSVGGEVVFNTGMAGYVEALTDPSYRGQILVLTYPLIGNYGVPKPRCHGGIDAPYESSRIQVQGLVVQNYVGAFSHRDATRSLAQWLAAEEVPAITGVDTRALTRHLREHGTMRGWLVADDDTVENARERAASIDMRTELFHLVAPAAPIHYAGGRPNILLVDAGAKDQLVRSLLESRRQCLARSVACNACRSSRRRRRHRDRQRARRSDGSDAARRAASRAARVVRAADLRRLSRQSDSRARGRRVDVQAAVRSPRAESAGPGSVVASAATSPVRITATRSRTNRCTSGWEPWFVNINDGTNEGIRSTTRPFFSVQFHPEAKPGPEDTAISLRRFHRDDTLDGAPVRALYGAFLPKKPRRVLVLGSGALQIGQAGEFDYSGSQAIKALKEEGVFTVLVNPNIATIQTSEDMADRIYLRRRHARVRRADHRQGRRRRDSARRSAVRPR